MRETREARPYAVVRSLGAVRLTLPEPPSANRWWRNVNGRMVTSKAARQYKAALAQLGGARAIDGPVCVTLVWFRARRSGDLDKRVGVLLDALQGVAYHNDSQIVELRARRVDDPANPRVEVAVEALEQLTGPL